MSTNSQNWLPNFFWGAKVEKRHEKNINDSRRPALKKTVEEKGKLWAIAAMVDASIGYHSFTSAEIRIRELMEDRYVSGCERTSACFGGDSIEAIAHDFRYFKAVEERDPEKAKRVIEFVKETAKLSHMGQWAVSSLYPTMNI